MERVVHPLAYQASMARRGAGNAHGTGCLRLGSGGLVGNI